MSGTLHQNKLRAQVPSKHHERTGKLHQRHSNAPEKTIPHPRILGSYLCDASTNTPASPIMQCCEAYFSEDPWLPHHPTNFAHPGGRGKTECELKLLGELRGFNSFSGVVCLTATTVMTTMTTMILLLGGHPMNYCNLFWGRCIACVSYRDC